VNKFSFGGGESEQSTHFTKVNTGENRGKVQIFLISGVYHTLPGPVLAKNSGPKTGSLNQRSVKWGPAKSGLLYYREYLQMCMTP
jgi:hypothetical protein